MGRLAVDHLGRVYEMSSDRADGLGNGKYPSCQSQSDLTLGNAYLKAQADRRVDLLRKQRQNQIITAQDEINAVRAKQSKAQAQMREDAKALIDQHPVVKQNLLKKALQMGCSCDQSNQMAGKLTANGETGWNGMNRDQKIIHHELVGMGYDVSHRSDPTQMRNHQMMKRAENLMRIKARK